MIKKYFVLSVITAILICETAPFGFSGVKGDAGLPGYFLNQGAGARAMGMGRAFTAVADDASAVYWNPAGMMNLQRNEIQLTHAELFESTRYDFAGLALSLSKVWGLGIGVAQLYSGNFVARDEFNNVTGSFSDQNTAAFLSGSYAVFPGKLAFGATVKGINKQFSGLNSTGYGLDAGIMAGPLKWLRLGVNLQNVMGPSVKREYLTDETPMSVNAGAACDLFKLFNLNSSSLLLAADINKTEQRSVKQHFGAELVLKAFAVRGGYDDGYFTGGFGLNTKFSIDYALVSHPDLGLSHRASIGFKWGAPTNTGDAVSQFLAKAVQHLAEGNKREALDACVKALELEPNNQEALDLKLKIYKKMTMVISDFIIGEDIQTKDGMRWAIILRDELAGAFNVPTRDEIIGRLEDANPGFNGVINSKKIKESVFREWGESTLIVPSIMGEEGDYTIFIEVTDKSNMLRSGKKRMDIKHFEEVKDALTKYSREFIEKIK